MTRTIKVAITGRGIEDIGAETEIIRITTTTAEVEGMSGAEIRGTTDTVETATTGTAATVMTGIGEIVTIDTVEIVTTDTAEIATTETAEIVMTETAEIVTTDTDETGMTDTAGTAMTILLTTTGLEGGLRAGMIEIGETEVIEMSGLTGSIQGVIQRTNFPRHQTFMNKSRHELR